MNTAPLHLIVGFLFIILSLIYFFTRKKLLAKNIKPGSKLFAPENSWIHETRIWIAIITHALIGIWVLFF